MTTADRAGSGQSVQPAHHELSLRSMKGERKWTLND
jgi:hypothetical protein